MPRPDRPERPVEPYEPEPNQEPNPRSPEPDSPERFPTYEDTPPAEPKDEEPLTVRRFVTLGVAIF